MDDTAIFLIGIGGLFVGVSFGALTQSSKICFINAVRQIVEKNISSLVPAFLIAMTFSLIGTQTLKLILGLDLSSSIYLTNSPSLITMALGAVIFAFGMILSNACPYRHIVLLASGNLRSFVAVLVIGISSYATIRGIIATPRLEIQALTETGSIIPSVNGLFAWATGFSKSLSTLIVTGVFSFLLLYIAWLLMPKQHNIYQYFSAIGLGLTVALGWYVTGSFAYDEFDPKPLESLSFVAPAGESLVYLMTFTGSTISFAIAVFFGVLLGAFLSSLFTKSFKWQVYESKSQMKRSILGSILMGIGAIFSLGCTIGQGLTGFSTLSIPSIMVIAIIFITSLFFVKKV